MFVKVDKLVNFYKLDVIEYNWFLNDNIIKIYKKVDKKKFNVINDEVRSVIRKFNIDDWVELIVINDVFIILKDYKENFVNKLICWLINLFKMELGWISKWIFEDINFKFVSVIKVN